MCVFGLGFTQRVRKTGGQAEIRNAQKRQDAGDRHPRAIALAAQISDRERNRDNTDNNYEDAPG